MFNFVNGELSVALVNVRIPGALTNGLLETRSCGA